MVLCNGKLISFKKRENIYKIFKKYINYKEIIYSIIEVDEDSFLITCGMNGCGINCCHFQIYDSNDNLIKYNSCHHYNLIKDKNNACKFNNDTIIFCLDLGEFSFVYKILCFNFKNNDYFHIKVSLHYYKVYKAFENSLMGVTFFNGKYSLYQIELFFKGNDSILTNKCGFLTTYEINNIFIFEDMIIVLGKNGNMIIYQIENIFLNLRELDIESKIKERNEKKNKKIIIIPPKNNEEQKLKNNNKEKYINLGEIKNTFNIIETESNGNCLFDSLGKNENMSSQKMRTILTDYLKENYKKVEGFEQALKLDNENINTYVERMKRNYEYGTNTEICAYSLVFKKNVIINIIDEDGNGTGLINPYSVNFHLKMEL